MKPRERDAPVLPSSRLRSHAAEVLQHMDGDRARFVLRDQEANYEIELQEDVYELLRNILIDLSQNRAIQILPQGMELTTVQAAEFLQVSRPFLIKLIDKGELECRMVGTHRRLELGKLIEYRERMQAASKNATDEMAREAQALGWE
jgi:excisionase family DNA binding protein